jgi:hypothetical protein
MPLWTQFWDNFVSQHTVFLSRSFFKVQKTIKIVTAEHTEKDGENKPKHDNSIIKKETKLMANERFEVCSMRDD